MTDTITAPESGARLLTLIEGIRVAMFATFGPSGEPRCRPMYLQKAEMGGELWFATSRASGVTTDLLRNGRVLLSFAAPERQSYVVVHGIGVVHHDRDMIDDLWTPAMEAWFPKGPNDPDLTLVHVLATQAEYWEAPAAPVRWLQFARAVLGGSHPPAVGEHATVKFGTP